MKSQKHFQLFFDKLRLWHRSKTNILPSFDQEMKHFTSVECKTENDAKRRGCTGSMRNNHKQNQKRCHTQGIII